jgi:hypothetical protein
MRRDFVCGSNVPALNLSGNGTPQPFAKRVVLHKANIGLTVAEVKRQADAAVPHDRVDR